ncbi:MAG: hypothetical protein V7742_16620 [Halioglobus sp.]
MPKKKMFIHVGPTKTGSTFIQSYLVRSSQASGSKIYYPIEGRFADKEPFARRAGGEIYSGSGTLSNHLGIFWGLIGALTSHLIDDLITDLVNECVGVEQDIIVLSCEGFSFFGVEQVDRLLQRLCEFDVKVIYFYRDPLHRSQSVYFERIRTGDEVDSFSAFLSNAKEPIFIEKAIENAWATAGESNIYRLDFGTGENLLEIFFEILDEPLLGSIELEGEQLERNERFGQSTLKLILLLNRIQHWNSRKFKSRLTYLLCVNTKHWVENVKLVRVILSPLAVLLMPAPLINEATLEHLRQLASLE